MPRAALSLLLLLALAAAPADAKTYHLNYFIDEDEFCGAHPDSISLTPQVETRDTRFRAPKKFIQFRGWAAISLVLHIGADGRVAAMTIRSENPPGEGLADAARKAFTGWTFTPGRPGDYCIQISLTNDPKARPPVDNPDDPVAPAPVVRIIPDYPQAALENGVEADVLLAVTIATNGAVSGTAVIHQSNGDYDFGVAAYRAVRKWRFPADTPPGRYRLIIRFRLA